MAWRLAKSLERMREQINLAFPKRDRTSDGGIGDTAHASRKSDHNPWVKIGSTGIVTAIDIDEDVDATGTVEPIVKALQASGDKRIKYIIYESRITVKGDITRWKKYAGANAHKHHAHISVQPDPRLFDDARDWQLGLGNAPAPAVNVVAPPPIVRKGSLERERILTIQIRLMLKADGHFGPKTEDAVKAFQKQNGLKPDGIVGAETWTRILE